MTVIRFLTASCIFFLFIFNLSGQVTDPRISLSQALEELETQNGFRIFFDHNYTDTILVERPLTIDNLPVWFRKLQTSHEVFFFTDEKNLIVTVGKKISDRSIIYYHDALPDPEISADSLIVPPVEPGQGTITIGKPGGTKNPVVSGYIRDMLTGEPIPGVTIFNKSLKTGCISDANGYYVMECPPGKHTLHFSCMGMKTRTCPVHVLGSGTLSVEMEEEIIRLNAVQVVAAEGDHLRDVKMGTDRLDMKSIKQIPSFGSEPDIIKTTLLLPGVQSVGEGAAGFNVRGGSTDQNLILLNHAPVFNASHFFGFFSSFNSDLIRDFNLYKSSIPAEYGGRISSVLDIHTRNGNVKEYKASAGLGAIFGKLTIEGPVLQDKGAFVLGGRTTYSNWIMRRLDKLGLSNSKAAFTDFNITGHLSLNRKNSVHVSGYQSFDAFKLNYDTTYQYQNMAFSLGYKHNFTDRLINKTYLIFSQYHYGIEGNSQSRSGFSMKYRINYHELKSGFSFFASGDHTIHFGGSAILYTMFPGSLMPKGGFSQIDPVILEREKAREVSVYLSDEFLLSDRITLYIGYRHSFYFLVGPGIQYIYLDNRPMEPYTILEEKVFSSNSLIQSYNGPEYRISARFRLDMNSAIKLSFNRTRQYLHMLSNTTAISPTDTWKLSDPDIPPQIGDQISAGYYRDFLQKKLHGSFEIYGKLMQNFPDYKSGAKLILNKQIETDLLFGEGYAYGVEMMLKKDIGRLNGWIGYTYSRAFILINSRFEEEKVNGGKLFPANYDKPHDITGFVNYRFSRRFSVSTGTTYSTGRPITYPATGYSFQNIPLLHYTNRNEYRLPDYFRVDLSANLEGNLKVQKLAHSFWSLSVYNLTGRDNVYSVFFISENGRSKGYKLSVFSRPVVTLSLNLEF